MNNPRITDYTHDFDLIFDCYQYVQQLIMNNDSKLEYCSSLNDAMYLKENFTCATVENIIGKISDIS